VLLRESSEPRVVPAPALVEVDYFVPPQAFARLLQDVETGAFLIEELRVADYARVAQLLAEYADLRVGFVDAAVLAIVERLGEPRLATLDHRHFSVMRPAHLETLELVPGR
jgi:predicted nucleic acid-binding protein